MQTDASVEAACTSCSAVYRVTEKFLGKTVSCRKCGASFEVSPQGGNCPIIGKLALKYRFVRQEQLDAAVDVFDAQNDPSASPLEKILVDMGFISEKQRSILLTARDYLDIRQQDKEIGDIMVRKGLCNRQQVEEALAEQSRGFKENQSVCRIEDILSGRGIQVCSAPPKAREIDAAAEPSVPAAGEGSGTIHPGELPKEEELKIPGDVDQETGDIDFNGNVVVSGCIMRGCRVKCRSLEAAEVSGGEIEASSDVTVAGGVVGAVIRTKGAFRARYIKGARISAYGDVSVEKEINESEIVTSGACRIPNGTILSSEIAAKMGIFAGDIGTEMSNPSKLRAGVDEHIERELQFLEAALQERSGTLEKLQKTEQGLHQTDQDLYARITELAQVQDRSMIEKRSIQKKMEAKKGEGDAQDLSGADQLKVLDDRIKAAEEEIVKHFEERDRVSEELKSISEKIHAVKEEIEKIHSAIRFVSAVPERQQANPKVTVYRSIFEGTVVTTPHATKTLPRTGMNLLISEVKKHSFGTEEKWEIGFFFRKKGEAHLKSA